MFIFKSLKNLVCVIYQSNIIIQQLHARLPVNKFTKIFISLTISSGEAACTVKSWIVP